MAISGVTDYTNTYAADRANGSSSLNGKIQDYLNSLKEKYSGVNITVADFKSGRQEDAYMLGSRGYNNIAVSSSIIEKMASDPAAAAKYEKVFAEMSGNSERIEKFARENNDEIYSAQVLLLTRMERYLTGWSTEVSKSKTINGERTQVVRIFYKFVGVIG